MFSREYLDLIEETISLVEGDYSIERLVQDCADKLSLSFDEVMCVLVEFDSIVLKKV